MKLPDHMIKKIAGNSVDARGKVTGIGGLSKGWEFKHSDGKGILLLRDTGETIPYIRPIGVRARVPVIGDIIERTFNLALSTDGQMTVLHEDGIIAQISIGLIAAILSTTTQHWVPLDPMQLESFLVKTHDYIEARLTETLES
jgi:hypothetical protein